MAEVYLEMNTTAIICLEGFEPKYVILASYLFYLFCLELKRRLDVLPPRCEHEVDYRQFDQKCNRRPGP